MCATMTTITTATPCPDRLLLNERMTQIIDRSIDLPRADALAWCKDFDAQIETIKQHMRRCPVCRNGSGK